MIIYDKINAYKSFLKSYDLLQFYRLVVMDIIEIVRNKIDERLSVGNDDAFYILDLEDVRQKYRKWIETIPRVKTFYAVKCNDDEKVLETLANLGSGFDCASKKELSQILKLGVDPERIIYANTVKQISHLKYSEEKKIEKVTFDSPAELEKIKKFHPNAKVVLRIRFDATTSIICLGIKFGCDPISEAPELIKMCRVLNMNLIGISFHVGSGTSEYPIYERALQSVHKLFNVATDFGFMLNFVDIGGGFCGNDFRLLDNYATYINRGIDKYFPDQSVTIIAEPGRYFAESAFTLAVQVMLKKVSSDRRHMNYYINDGIYQSFLISYIYEENLQFSIIRKSDNVNSEDHQSTVWGATCNSKDKIISNRMIPELDIGDWLIFQNFGAYTTAVSTNFNGFKASNIIRIN